MSNKTIIISNDINNNSLTNFNKVDMSPYDNYQKQYTTFKRNYSQNRTKEYEISFNPFLSASSDVFKYTLQITNDHNTTNAQNPDEIKDTLISKINLFDENALKLGIENTEVLVTRYILCTFVDEMITTSLIGNNNNWTRNSLLNIFHKESYGGENFFHLLDKFLKTPAKYIHILEFMYVCIALGFEGKYRIIDRGAIELNNIKDSLFRQIKIVQGRDPFTFYTHQEPSKEKYRLFDKVSYPVLFGGSLLLLSIVYGILTFSLHNQNSNFLNTVLNKQIQSIELLQE